MLEQPELVVAQGCLNTDAAAPASQDEPQDAAPASWEAAEPPTASDDLDRPVLRSRRSRVMVYLLSGVLLAGAASVGTWRVLTVHRDTPDKAAASSSACAPVNAAGLPPPAGVPSRLTVDFASLTCGFAAFMVQSPGQACSLAVRVTRDGGRTWGAAHDAGTIDCGAQPFVRALDTETVAVMLVHDKPEADTWLLSHDGGLRWTSYQLARTSDTRLRPWSHVFSVCDFGDCTADHALFTYDPANGNQVQVGGPNVGAVYRPQRAADGSLWAAAQPQDGRYAVAVSRDEGATWRETQLEYTGKGSEAPAVNTFDGRTGYVTIVEDLDRLIVFKTTDGGTTWTKPSVGRLPAEGVSFISSYATRDGALVVAGRNGLWYVADAALNFTRLDTGPPDSTEQLVLDIDGGLLALHDHQDDNQTAYLSSDGRTWRQIVNPLDS